jgi:hypothetical protein
MAQPLGFDTSKMSTADKLVAGSAFVFFIWSLLPFWYKLGGDHKNGFRGYTLFAALLAIVAVAEVAVRATKVSFRLPNRALVHLGVAGIAMMCTLLGMLFRISVLTVKYEASWGLYLAFGPAAIWNYGAYMMWNEPETSVPQRPPRSSIR